MSYYITLLITGVGSIAGLVNPFYGLLAYVTFAMIKPDALWSYSVEPGNYSRIIAISMTLGWLVRGFGSWKFGKGWAVTLCLILHVAWVGFGTFFVTPDFEKGYYIFESMLKILLPFLVGMTTIRTIRQLQILCLTIVLCTMYLAYELNHAYYLRGINLLRQSSFLTLDNNTAGILLAPTVGFIIFLVMDSKGWLRRIFYGGALLMVINAICFSDSRGTMVATLISGCVAFLIMPKRPIHFVMFVLVLAAGLRLAGTETLERFFTTFEASETRDYSAQSRLEMWGQALSVMMSNPLTGIGPGQWSTETMRFGWWEGKQVHSTWIQNGAEGGLIGFVVYLAFYLIVTIQMIRIAWAPTSMDLARPTLLTAARSVAASLCGFLVAAQFVTAWAIELPYYVALIGALIMKLRASTPPELHNEDWDVEEEWYEPEDEYLEEPVTA